MSFQSFSEFKDLDDAKLSEEIINAKKYLLSLIFLSILNVK
jgi:ribosomal protein L29